MQSAVIALCSHCIVLSDRGVRCAASAGRGLGRLGRATAGAGERVQVLVYRRGKPADARGVWQAGWFGCSGGGGAVAGVDGVLVERSGGFGLPEG